MDDFVRTQEPAETPPQPDTHSSAFDFEEALRQQNISTMIEIYGEEYVAKLDMLMR